jgi:diguanylate cyclase (GGDEF)-like protein
VIAEAPESDPLRESPVAEQLRRGFPWLRFDADLESRFREEHYADGLHQLRLNLAMALAIVIAFGAMEGLAIPLDGQRLAALVRYVVLIPGLLGCIAVTFLPNGARLYPPIVTVLAPFAVVAVAAVEIHAALHGSNLFFATLVLTTIFVYFLAGLMFYAAVVASAIGLVAYLVGGLAVDLPVYQVLYNAMVLLFANLVGTTVAYNLEFARRTGWLEAKLLGEMALRDGLTGIYNRRRLDEHLARAWQQGTREQRPMAVLMVDIDFFKAYNDRYGHQAGDEALKAVAGVMARAARRPLDFVARYGGEEFVVVLFDATREYAAELAARIHDGVTALAIRHTGSTVAPVLTVSVGVAFAVPVGGRSPEGLVQLADEALYTAKNRGRDCVTVMDAEYAQLKTGSFRVERT